MYSFSDVTGYVSIACWLGAQFPQVIENIRNQSVEGLALPFLVNWLLGDMTNLIGCILTNQLPFQTYLATYFCFVDISLMLQYFYYSRKAPPMPVSRSRSRARLSLDVHNPAHYRALSSVAANVAASAALAANQESHWQRRSTEILNDAATHIPYSQRAEEEDEVDEDALAALADSIHSTRSRHGATWNKEHYTGPIRALSPVQSLEPFPRGRAVERADTELEEDEQTREDSRRRRNSRASRMSASIVFMGAWALFGAGTLISSRRGIPHETDIRIGRVVADVSPSALPVLEDFMRPLSVLPLPPTEMLASLEFPDASKALLDEDIAAAEAPTMERVIGRVFAWTCTTLYLTSRLPQIWKNYVRKSVEGLSIYLFIFAFLGNFFYVLSILTAPNMYLPPPEASAYISESIPYLLGSGGTLMFDVTIVVQSRIYRLKRGRTKEFVGEQTDGDAEEQEALMSASIRDLDEAQGQTPRRRANVGEEGSS
ncbi:PQ loop repeat-domain-containing protein [Vararia minispora EC-137]|uniref:PQ loop repeat-domain-containing protein n=1 Tax=Vararia minispora EC-137 TaxID=1314806 RepID=A0ACB8QWC7_9AGAM|nr:PQ loop repeat-domain-containing protein [Vararia minispora EC-137]